MVASEKLSVPLQELVLYFDQLAACVKAELCDVGAVTSMMASQGRGFFRTYYPYICYLRKESNDQTVARDFELVFNSGSLGKQYCTP